MHPRSNKTRESSIPKDNIYFERTWLEINWHNTIFFFLIKKTLSRIFAILTISTQTEVKWTNH